MRVLVCGGEAFEDGTEFGSALDSMDRVFRVDWLARLPGRAGEWAGAWASGRDLPAMEIAAEAPGEVLDAAMPGAVVVFTGGGDFSALLVEARRREIIHDCFRLDRFREREASRRLYGLVSGETLLRSREGELGIFLEVINAMGGGLPYVSVRCALPGGRWRSRPFYDGWRRADAEGRPIGFPPEAERLLEARRLDEARRLAEDRDEIVPF